MHVHGKYSMNAMALSLSIVKRASPETGNARKLRNLGIAVGHVTQDLYVSASMIPYCEENAFANKVEDFFATCVLHVPAGMKKKYQNHKIWGKFTHIVEE